NSYQSMQAGEDVLRDQYYCRPTLLFWSFHNDESSPKLLNCGNVWIVQTHAHKTGSVHFFAVIGQLDKRVAYQMTRLNDCGPSPISLPHPAAHKTICGDQWSRNPQDPILSTSRGIYST